MNSFSKFLNCDRLICVKDGINISVGRVYQCLVYKKVFYSPSRLAYYKYSNGAIQIDITVPGEFTISFSDEELDSVDFVIEHFKPIQEHRRDMIESIINE